jgi:hypothetical protein
MVRDRLSQDATGRIAEHILSSVVIDVRIVFLFVIGGVEHP